MNGDFAGDTLTSAIVSHRRAVAGGRTRRPRSHESARERATIGISPFHPR